MAPEAAIRPARPAHPSQLETSKRDLARLGNTVEESGKEMKAIKAEIAHISLGRMDKIGMRHKQELVEQMSQPTSAHDE